MRLTAGCQLNFEAQAPAPLILMLRPQSGASQRILADQWQIEPELPTIEYVDLYGNACDRRHCRRDRHIRSSAIRVQSAIGLQVSFGSPRSEAAASGSVAQALALQNSVGTRRLIAYILAVNGWGELAA